MDPVPRNVSHRPFPPPARPWVLAQSWRQVLFAHWSFPAHEVRELLPPGLMLDTFDGRAWLGVVPFRMTGVHGRGLPGVPGARCFPELNVRTYVCVGESPGVHFFSLDATSRLVIAAARAWFRLPYLRAEMSMEHAGDEVRFCSRRTDARAAPAELQAAWQPEGEVFSAPRGSLEHWLTERYALFSVAADGRVLRGDVHHDAWPLHRARAELTVNSMLSPLGLAADRAPDSLLASPGVDVQTWWPRVVYRPVAARLRG